MPRSTASQYLILSSKGYSQRFRLAYRSLVGPAEPNVPISHDSTNNLDSLKHPQFNPPPPTRAQMSAGEYNPDFKSSCPG